jgi:glycosyltransferase involved in cell wall biosynthesis
MELARTETPLAAPPAWPAPAMGARTLRVLAFVEARGVTGHLRNLIDTAPIVRQHSPSIEIEIATYWRSPAPGMAGPRTADIQVCLDAAARAGLRTHTLHERRAGDPRLLEQIRALVHRRSPDIVETHHVKSHFLMGMSGAAEGRRWVAFHHGYTTTSMRTRMHNVLDLWSLRQPDALVTPCGAFAAQLVRLGVPRDRINVLHSSVRPECAGAAAIDAVRRTLGVSAGVPLVLSVGRLSREKAHAHLIAALANPALARLGAVLVLVGDGPERARLERLALRSGLSDRVRFAGRQSDVWPYYYAADVVALPSDTEGSPNVLLEAMAVGRPVVATRVGGIPEIAQHGQTALLVEPGRPDALAAAVARLLAEPGFAHQLGAHARPSVVQRFSPEARARGLSTVYQRVCRP